MSCLLVETTADAVALFRAALPKGEGEACVFVLPLDANGKALAKPVPVSAGSEDGSATVDAGTILREALTRGADEIIVACNHPSGDPRPSKADMAAVETLRAAAKLLGVTFVDHIILGAADSAGGQGFTSLAELAAEEAEG